MNIELKRKPYSVVDILIAEQIRNERVGATIEERRILIQNLTKQTPNRIYHGEDNLIGRVLLYSVEFEHEAFIEVTQLKGDFIRKVRSESFIGLSPLGIEREIQWLRKQWGLSGDILTQPSSITQVISPDSFNNGSYVHTGSLSNRPSIYCCYKIPHHNDLGPRLYGIQTQAIEWLPGDRLIQLSTPPDAIMDYANRFSITQEVA